jgi:predicted nucleic acid-binding Zn ribbon protein
MFKRDVQQVKDLILQAMREQGLETPLNQKRLVDAWPEVAGPLIASYTLNTYIYNQTLYVRLSSPALRADLSMRRQELTARLNAVVGEQVITDVRFG